MSKKIRCKNCLGLFDKDELIFFRACGSNFTSVLCKKCDKNDEERTERVQQRELAGRDCLSMMNRNHTRFNHGLSWESEVTG